MKIDEKNIERKQFFLKKVGDVLWRSKTDCTCESCMRVYKEGIHVDNEQQALYLYDYESVTAVDGFPVKYFETKEERDNFEKK